MCTHARTAARRGFGLAIGGTILTMASASAPSLFYPQLAEQLALPPVATTAVFAVYAFTMLATLLFLGPLSDTKGRRPVVTVGALLLAASLVLFWRSENLGLLLVARSLQGVAAGLLIPALSAVTVDFEPPHRPGRAALWNTVAPMMGLGTGAMTAALLLDVTADPAGAVFGTLTGLSALTAVLVWLVPESAGKTPASAGPVRPRFRASPRLRGVLLVAAPAIVAGSATNGLFLALGAGLVKSEFGAATHAQAGSVMLTLAVSGILASRLLSRRSSRVITVYGTSALAIGTVLSLAALAAHSFPAYLATVVIVGSGFGTSFMGALRTLMPYTVPAERAAIMGVIYSISYLALGVPTIVAGLLVPVLTVQGTMAVLGVAIAVLGVVATIARLRLRSDEPAREPAAARQP
ncbi:MULTISPECIES: MFS transporter [unclassified Streptomyces]|uniref:MFS transporter n=1 Tax=unclassified Streptomyces TaxID=2593676 RepID=UPI002DD921C5|nr:MFS transporter [Streptomyces sp. NBC_01237]WRZ77437.1 MFS transporter [Streptomyces sp. NBC_01237]